MHTHAPFATTLACLDRGIPPFHYMVARAGGRDIRCAPYATFGTQELSDHAVRRTGGTPRVPARPPRHDRRRRVARVDALALAVEVETLAEMYWRALAVGDPRCLSDAEMARVVAKFARLRPGLRPRGPPAPTRSSRGVGGLVRRRCDCHFLSNKSTFWANHPAGRGRPPTDGT